VVQAEAQAVQTTIPVPPRKATLPITKRHSTPIRIYAGGVTEPTSWAEMPE